MSSSSQEISSVTSKDSVSNVQDNVRVEIRDSDDSSEQHFETPVECVEIPPVGIYSSLNKSRNPTLIPSYDLNLDDSNMVLGITRDSSSKVI